jgi:prevent-host-death family protein
MASIGVRDLKNHLSECLRRVRQGESLVVTDRGKAVAEISPLETSATGRRARGLVRQGVAQWSGGKPQGLVDAPRPAAGLVSDAVLEDRR